MQIVYSLVLMLAYAIAIRFTLVYIGVMSKRVQTFKASNAWLHAIAITIILNDFFSIFRW